MKKALQNKIILLKEIKPEKRWVAGLRKEVFSKDEAWLFNPVSFEKAVGSLALAGVTVLMIFFGLSAYFQEMTDIEFIYREAVPAKESKVEAREVDKNKELLDYLVSEVEIEDLSEYAKLSLAMEGTAVIMEEIAEIEEIILNLSTAKE